MRSKADETFVIVETFIFIILKIEVCFSVYFRKITPSVCKIYLQGVNLPPVKNPWFRRLKALWLFFNFKHSLQNDLTVKLLIEKNNK